MGGWIDVLWVLVLFLTLTLLSLTASSLSIESKPTVRVAAKNVMFDSTTDQIKCPEPNDSDPSKMGTGVRQMYVTYHDAQAYPEYLIDYRL